MELILIVHLGVLLTLLPVGVPAVAWAIKHRQQPTPGGVEKLARLVAAKPVKSCGCSCRNH